MKLALTLALLFPLWSSAQPIVYPYSDGKKWGLTNEAREVLAAPQIDENFQFFSDRSARVKVNGKVGILAPTGKFTLQPIYDAIQDLGPVYATAGIGGKQIGVNMKTGKEFGKAFEEVQAYCYCDDNYFIVRKGNKFGLLDPVSDKLVSKLIYDAIKFDFDNRKAAYVTVNKKQGVIEMKTGKMIVPISFDKVEETYFNEGQISMVSGYKATSGGMTKGFNHEGKEVELTAANDASVVEMAIDGAPWSEENSAKREMFVYDIGNNQWKVTFENRSYSSTEILDAFTIEGYDKVEKMSDMWFPPKSTQYVRAWKNGKVGILDHTGKVVIPIEYDAITGVNNEYYVTKLKGLTGVLDRTHSLIRKPDLKSVLEYSYGLKAWLVELPDGQKGYMTAVGRILIPGLTD